MIDSIPRPTYDDGMRGRFITFEGGEGAGKSTQSRRLAASLRAAGRTVVETREPGGSPFAERVRKLILDPDIPPHAPLSEALLFYSARADHLASVITPALEAGSWVICDRFSDSTRVYQGLVGGLAPETIGTLERLVVGRCKPDLTLLLDLDPALGLERVRQRRTESGIPADNDSDAYEARDLDFHVRLRAGFRRLANDEPGRIVVLDGGLAADELERRVLDAVARRLGGR